MERYLTKATIATILYLLGLGINTNRVNAATLFVGRYGSFVRDINSVGFIPESKIISTINKSPKNKLTNSKKQQIEAEKLISNIDSLGSSEALKEQIQEGYISFEESKTKDSLDSEVDFDINNYDLEEITKHNSLQAIDGELMAIADPDTINQDIRDRYYGLVETNEEEVSLFESNQLTKELVAVEGGFGQKEPKVNNSDSNSLIQKALQENQIHLQQNSVSSSKSNSKSSFPQSIILGFVIIAIGGSCATLIPIFGIRKQKKELLPEAVITLHKKTLNKVISLARKLERMDDEKFTNEEFVLYMKLKNKIELGFRKKEPDCLSIKYLEVGLLAQSSFLQLEQTELKYRSRKQQEFYDFVANNIDDNVDKAVFRNQVKRKLAEIIPLVHTQEGRTALQSYLKEVEKISQHDLGLKLLSLFKKYQLADFSILNKISRLVEQSTAYSLLIDESLSIVVLENYDTFQKVAPIIEIKEEDIQPKFFTKVLHYLGLGRRHEKSYQEFQDLIKVLQKWQQPVEALKAIRQQYYDKEYQLPNDFYREIPGLNLYKKYEKYLEQKD